jgi:hypothetical protein
MDGDTFSKNNTAPSPPRTGSLRAAFLISETASLMRLIAGCERHPKACRLKRARNVHFCLLPKDMSVSASFVRSIFRFLITDPVVVSFAAWVYIPGIPVWEKWQQLNAVQILHGNIA